ncbi:metalloproteinase inhibitor 4 [Mixophyes fleayi]|uniref:metalloproteinase inhibitor 4 n=1 Tax=Mixophyes fleayi TaxID=3061075 RepID=UPI003F4E1A05
MNPITRTVLLGALLLFTLKELTEACSCLYSHPQEQFCHADVVVRATVTGEKTSPSVNEAPRTITYTINTTKMFKGVDKMKALHSVQTPYDSAACGRRLEKREYLITGFISNNKVRISLCGLVQPWETLSPFQVQSLSTTYQQGCALCQIKNCAVSNCDVKAPNECNWNVTDHNQAEKQALNQACTKQKGGSCNWYPALHENPAPHP